MKKRRILIIALLACVGGLFLFLLASEEEKTSTHHLSSDSKANKPTQSSKQARSDTKGSEAESQQERKESNGTDLRHINRETLESNASTNDSPPGRLVPPLDQLQSIFKDKSQEDGEEMSILNQTKKVIEGALLQEEEQTTDSDEAATQTDLQQVNREPLETDFNVNNIPPGLVPPTNQSPSFEEMLQENQEEMEPIEQVEQAVEWVSEEVDEPTDIEEAFADDDDLEQSALTLPQQHGYVEVKEENADNITDKKPKERRKQTPQPSTSLSQIIVGIFKTIWAVTFDYPTRLSYSLWSGFWAARWWDFGTYFGWGDYPEKQQRRKMASYEGSPFAYKVKEVKSSSYSVLHAKWSQKYANNSSYHRSSSLFSRYRQIFILTLLIGGFTDLLTNHWQTEIANITSGWDVVVFSFNYFTKGTWGTTLYLIEKVLYPIMQLICSAFITISPLPDQHKNILGIPTDRFFAFLFCFAIFIYFALSLLWGILWHFEFPIRSFIYALLVLRTLYVVLDIEHENTQMMSTILKSVGTMVGEIGKNGVKNLSNRLGFGNSLNAWFSFGNNAEQNGQREGLNQPLNAAAQVLGKKSGRDLLKQAIDALVDVSGKVAGLAFKINLIKAKEYLQAGFNKRNATEKKIFIFTFIGEVAIVYIWLGQIRYLWTSHYIESYNLLLAAPYQHKLVSI